MDENTAALIAKRFIERRDVKAEQQKNGAYHPVTDGDPVAPSYLPWKMSDIREHLAGRRTYGHYLLSADDRCRLFAFDLDLTKTGNWFDLEGNPVEGNPRDEFVARGPGLNWLISQLRTLAEGLAERTMTLLDIPVAIAFSGHKGLHVYGFTGPVPAQEARDAAMTVLSSFGIFELARGKNFWRRKPEGDSPAGWSSIEIEVFPKQDSLDGKELGNLMRLPLGINQKTKRQSFFLDVATPHNTLVPADTNEVLEHGTRW